MKKRKKLTIMMILAFLIALVSCLKEEKSEPVKPEITFSHEEINLRVGQMHLLEVEVKNGLEENIVWEIDESFLSFEANEIKALKVGKTQITATIDDVSSSMVVNILASDDVPLIALNHESVVLKVGSEFELTATSTYLFEEVVPQEILWESEDSNIASVEKLDNNMAKVIAHQVGETVIVVRAVYNGFPLLTSLSVKVIV